jgi:hypothetical protein
VGVLVKTTLVLTILIAPLFVPLRAHAQMETCDRFSFAVSQSRLNEIPVTVLRGGMSPVLEIAGQAFNYDTGSHCMAEAGAKIDCEKPVKVTVDKKVVALIEGKGHVWISPVDAKGKRDSTQPHYEVSVERDPTNTSRPLFVVQAIDTDGKVLGRVDGVEGMTAPALQMFKGKLASAHRLIDLRGKNLVYANCRKLAVMRYYDGASAGRAIASARGVNKAPAMAPNPMKLKLNSSSFASEAPASSGPNVSKPGFRK